HVRARFASNEGAVLKATAFRCAEEPLGRALLAARGRMVHVVGSLELDHWQGETRGSLRMKDMAEVGEGGVVLDKRKRRLDADPGPSASLPRSGQPATSVKHASAVRQRRLIAAPAARLLRWVPGCLPLRSAALQAPRTMAPYTTTFFFSASPASFRSTAS